MKVKNKSINKIFIIESLNDELKTGDILFNHINSTNIIPMPNNSFTTVDSKINLFATFENIINNTVSNDGIIIDIECHGNVFGLILNNNDFVSWSELTSYFKEVNIKTKTGLIVILSCCFGGHYYLNEIDINDRAPFYLCFCPDGKIFEQHLSKFTRDLIDSFIAEANIEIVLQSINNHLQLNTKSKYIIYDPGTIFEIGYTKYLKQFCSKEGIEYRLKLYRKDFEYLSKSYGKTVEHYEKRYIDYILNKDRMNDDFKEYQDHYLCLDLDSTLYNEYEVEFDNICEKVGFNNFSKAVI